MKPICVPCQRFFRPKRNGVKFIENMPIDRNAKPGTLEPGRWQPYKLWVGDLWECSGCGTTIISGMGNAPMAEHYEEDFNEKVQRYNAKDIQVNDC